MSHADSRRVAFLVLTSLRYEKVCNAIGLQNLAHLNMDQEVAASESRLQMGGVGSAFEISLASECWAGAIPDEDIQEESEPTTGRSDSPHSNPDPPADSESDAGSDQTPPCPSPVANDPQCRDEPTMSSHPTKPPITDGDAAGELSSVMTAQASRVSTGRSGVNEHYHHDSQFPGVDESDSGRVPGSFDGQGHPWDESRRRVSPPTSSPLLGLLSHQAASPSQPDPSPGWGTKSVDQLSVNGHDDASGLATIPRGSCEEGQAGTGPAGLSSDAVVGNTAPPASLSAGNDMHQPTSGEIPGEAVGAEGIMAVTSQQVPVRGARPFHQCFQNPSPVPSIGDGQPAGAVNPGEAVRTEGMGSITCPADAEAQVDGGALTGEETTDATLLPYLLAADEIDRRTGEESSGEAVTGEGMATITCLQPVAGFPSFLTETPLLIQHHSSRLPSVDHADDSMKTALAPHNIAIKIATTDNGGWASHSVEFNTELARAGGIADNGEWPFAETDAITSSINAGTDMLIDETVTATPGGWAFHATTDTQEEDDGGWAFGAAIHTQGEGDAGGWAFIARAGDTNEGGWAFAGSC